MVTISTIMSTTSSCHRNSEACELNIHPSWAKWVPPSSAPPGRRCACARHGALPVPSALPGTRCPTHRLATSHASMSSLCGRGTRSCKYRASVRCRAAPKATPCVNSRVSIRLDAKPCLFFGNVAPGVAKVQSPFPRVRGSLCKSCPQKVHRTVARAQFALQNVKNLHVRSIVGRWGRQNKMCTVSSISHKNQQKLRSNAEPCPFSALREHWSIWCRAPPAMRVCNCR